MSTVEHDRIHDGFCDEAARIEQAIEGPTCTATIEVRGHDDGRARVRANLIVYFDHESVEDGLDLALQTIINQLPSTAARRARVDAYIAARAESDPANPMAGEVSRDVVSEGSVTHG
jgi:hypothetical protein